MDIKKTEMYKGIEIRNVYYVGWILPAGITARVFISLEQAKKYIDKTI